MVLTTAHQHGFECGCTQDLSERPAKAPESIRQEIRISWDDCVIALEDEVAEPWVTFRKAKDTESWIAHRQAGGAEVDEDHAYIRFSSQQDEAKIEVTSPGFGLIGCVLIDLFLGNQIDISRLYNGHSLSRIVDLSKIMPDQVWIHTSMPKEAMRRVKDAEEMTAIRGAFQLAREIRLLARMYLTEQTISVDDIRNAIEHDGRLLTAATNLRQSLSPFALDVENTELFRLAQEMEAEMTRA